MKFQLVCRKFKLVCTPIPERCDWSVQTHWSEGAHVCWGRYKAPTLNFVLGKGAPVPWPLENKDFISRGIQKGLIKIIGYV